MTITLAYNDYYAGRIRALPCTPTSMLTCESLVNLAKDVTLSTTMISGLAFDGHGTKGLDLFWDREKEGVPRNGVKVLDTTRHAGLLFSYELNILI